ncbi:MAG: hypothetical protein U0228_24665 [Myxococcaceae bacterium]
MRGGARTRLTLLALCCAVVSSAVGCADSKVPPPKFRLEGSLGQVMDLSFDEARVIIAPSDVSVLFVRIKPLESLTIDDGGTQMMGTTEDYPIKVAYQLLGDPPPLKGTYDLAADAGAGAQRGVVSRNVQGDPRNTFPNMARGELKFDQDIEPGKRITGSFHVTFENGKEVASGRTVFLDSFAAQVEP